MTRYLPEIIVLLWGASELCLSMAKRSKSNAASKDRHSLEVILLVNLSAIALGILASYLLRECAIPWPRHVLGFGLCLFVLGLALRWYSIFHLGRFFTTNVAIAKDHHLIESGPYHFLRHPSYSGNFLAVLGFTLSFTNWASFLIIFVPCIVVTMWRIRIEEQALVAAFGEAYTSYMRRTKRLIPLIY
jgi:protein-S-isoprenylcysteine O-methyltransferase